jgi:hypothetical protein
MAEETEDPKKPIESVKDIKDEVGAAPEIKNELGNEKEPDEDKTGILSSPPPTEDTDSQPEQLKSNYDTAHVERVETEGSVVPIQRLSDTDMKTSFIHAGAVIKDTDVTNNIAAPVTGGVKVKKADLQKNAADYQMTRFGAGKEVLVDKLSEPGEERHYDHINPDFITGRTNEYPRA